MTLHDFMKRVDVENEENQHKMLIIMDESGGWSNVNVEQTDTAIIFKPDYSSPFSDGG